MLSITRTISEITKKAFSECGFEGFGDVSISNRPDLCQFQCNSAFNAAKIFRTSPMKIASDVCEKLSGRTDVFSSVTAVAPGFINITLNDDFLVSYVNQIIDDENTGIATSEKKETILIDYGGPNVAKPLHIGHLRSAIIGQSLKKLAKKLGHDAFGDIHLGDWGLQIGLIITELKERFPDLRCFAEDFDPQKDTLPEMDMDMLNEVYPTASAKSKEDEDYSKRAHIATAQLQSGRLGYIALWKKIIEASVKSLRSNYENLNVDFEYWLGESDTEKYIPRLLSILKEKKLLRESDGALVVDVAEESDKVDIPPVLIQKADGASLYATTDLATLIQREEDFKPDRIWYVVDNRQALHFTQVFRCARKAGIVPDDVKLEHLGFGTMNGQDGKPYKTRAGGVMKLSDLLGTVTDAAMEKLKDSDYIGQLSDDEKKEVSRKVGIAAVKFGDLMNQRTKDYIFDMDKFLSFEGKTGTYILYMITRINSILKKLGISYDAVLPLKGIYSKTEEKLLLDISMTSEQFAKAFEERFPNYICDNVFKIASDFSSFYHDNRIIDQPDENKKNSWIALLLLTRKILIMHLDVLGIEHVENM